MIAALLLPLTLMLVPAPPHAGASPAPQQQPSAPTQTFDVVSIRPSDPKNTGSAVKPDPNNFIMMGTSLKFLIQYAYDLHGFQLEGAPAWTSSTRFDIIAKSERPANPAPPDDLEARLKLVRARLQSLLADRFQLRAHKGKMDMPVYGLVVAKGGPKLQASIANTGYTTGRGQFACSDFSMDDLASLLSGTMDRMVLDQTNLTGGYKFTLKWTPDESPDPNPDLPGIFTAIQEQLGLKLIPTKGPVEMLIIDHIEKPSEN
jgi:bla regulator protein BlaR1